MTDPTPLTANFPVVSGRVRWALIAALCAVLVALLWSPARDARSAPNWGDLITPLAPGLPVTRNYILYGPRRGEEHDVVFVARRDEAGSGPAGIVEVHILDRGRWGGVHDTASYGVGYEVSPRSTASTDDCEAVTRAIASAVARNDRGFGAVDSVAIETQVTHTRAARLLANLRGVRGGCVGILALALIALLATGRYGVTIAASALGLVAFGLRALALGLPFVRDQDVQRVFTGALPVGPMFALVIANERRPPFYFALLHVAEWFGQAESTVRIPAVLAGALAAPAIVWASWCLRSRVDLRTIIAALVITVSPGFIAHSREVSEFSLYGLLSILAVTSTSRMCVAPTRRMGVAVAVSHALLLWVTYLAPFTIAGEIIGLVATKSMTRRCLRAVAAGVIAGSPSVLMAIAAFFRDRHARQVAHDYPMLAWGERTPMELLSEIAHDSREALGAGVLICAACIAIHSATKRDAAPVVATTALVTTIAAIALLAPVARMQPYYVFGALTLVPLAIASANIGRRWIALLLTGSLAVAFCAALVPSLGLADGMYVADAEAFGPRFAASVKRRPERTLAVVAHYDGTMMAYYLARAYGARASWRTFSPVPPRARLGGTPITIVALAEVHDLNPHSDADAAGLLSRTARAEPILVLQRFDFRLPQVDALLARCDVLASAPVARLLRCAAFH